MMGDWNAKITPKEHKELRRAFDRLWRTGARFRKWASGGTE